MHLITSTWLLRLFLNRKVFLLWPIERCNRGLSGRDSPELSSFGLVGLSWLVTVSPDKIKRVINSLHIWNITLYSTIYPCCSSILRIAIRRIFFESKRSNNYISWNIDILNSTISTEYLSNNQIIFFYLIFKLKLCTNILNFIQIFLIKYLMNNYLIFYI